MFLPYFGFKGVEGGNPILFSLKFVESGVCSHGCCFLSLNLSCLISNGEKTGHGFFKS